jgi:hypothetical protein
VKPFAVIAALPKAEIVDFGEDGCALRLRLKAGATAQIIASWGMGWDHVSATVIAAGRPRVPTWDEMVAIKRALFRDDEWAIEYHPPPDANISIADTVLHLWRPQAVAIPTPPRVCV